MESSVPSRRSDWNILIILSVFGSLSQISFRSLLTRNIRENRPFIRVPYILLGHDPEEGQPRTKREDFGIIVIMQKQVND